MKSLLLISLVLVVGCGESGFGQLGTSSKQPNKAAKTADASTQSGSSDQKAGTLTEPKAEPTVVPPSSVLGSYLFEGIAVGHTGVSIPNADVILEEANREPQIAKTNASGRFRLTVAEVENVQKITLKRQTATGTISNTVVFTSVEWSRLKDVLIPIAESGTASASKVLEISATATDGDPLSVINIYDPAKDRTPPRASFSMAEQGTLVKVTVQARDDESGLHALAYSFNGGATWGSQNSINAAANTVFQAGTIRVRDKAGNITIVNQSTVTAGQ